MFFATGFETTAVATAAAVLGDPPPNFFVLSAHKYIPPVMEIVAEMPDTRVEGFLAAGHAATITGWGVFEPFVERHQLPVVVAGFEPLDILAGLVKLVELIRDGTPSVENMFPRCVTQGRQPARAGAAVDACSVRSAAAGAASRTCPTATCACATSGRTSTRAAASTSISNRSGTTRRRRSSQECICGDIMAGIKSPTDCALFGKECVPDSPVGACMVSSEGTCRIWHQYGGHPDLGGRTVALSVLDERITLKYGAGGRAMRTLDPAGLSRRHGVAEHADGDIGLAAMDDGAALRVGDRWLVVTTDSHVIHPVFFPGGDIGRLAVSGTVNDLAMMGATEVLGADLRRDHRGRLQPRRSRAHSALDPRRPATRPAPRSSPATPR